MDAKDNLFDSMSDNDILSEFLIPSTDDTQELYNGAAADLEFLQNIDLPPSLVDNVYSDWNVDEAYGDSFGAGLGIENGAGGVTGGGSASFQSHEMLGLRGSSQINNQNVEFTQTYIGQQQFDQSLSMSGQTQNLYVNDSSNIVNNMQSGGISSNNGVVLQGNYGTMLQGNVVQAGQIVGNSVRLNNNQIMTNSGSLQINNSSGISNNVVPGQVISSNRTINIVGGNTSSNVSNDAWTTQVIGGGGAIQGNIIQTASGQQIIIQNQSTNQKTVNILQGSNAGNVILRQSNPAIGQGGMVGSQGGSVVMQVGGQMVSVQQQQQPQPQFIMQQHPQQQQQQIVLQQQPSGQQQILLQPASQQIVIQQQQQPGAVPQQHIILQQNQNQVMLQQQQPQRLVLQQPTTLQLVDASGRPVSQVQLNGRSVTGSPSVNGSGAVNRTIQVTPDQLRLLQQSAQMQQVLLGRQIDVLQLLQQQQQQPQQQQQLAVMGQQQQQMLDTSGSNLGAVMSSERRNTSSPQVKIAPRPQERTNMLKGSESSIMLLDEKPIGSPSTLVTIQPKSANNSFSSVNNSAQASRLGPQSVVVSSIRLGGSSVQIPQGHNTAQHAVVTRPAAPVSHTQTAEASVPLSGLTKDHQLLLTKIDKQMNNLMSKSRRSEQEERGLKMLIDAKQKIMDFGRNQSNLAQANLNTSSSMTDASSVGNAQASVSQQAPANNPATMSGGGWSISSDGRLLPPVTTVSDRGSYSSAAAIMHIAANQNPKRNVGKSVGTPASQPAGSNTASSAKKAEDIFKLYPQLREKLNSQLAHMPPEKREWFNKNKEAVFRKLQQQHEMLLKQRQNETEQQQQQQLDVKAEEETEDYSDEPPLITSSFMGRRIISSSSSRLSANNVSTAVDSFSHCTTAAGVKVEAAAVTAAANESSAFRSSAAEQAADGTMNSAKDLISKLFRHPKEMRSQIKIQLYLAKDQKRATHPDCSAAFQNKNDALRCLVPYHVYQEADEPPELTKQLDDEYEERARELLEFKDAMLEKYRYLLNNESQLPNVTSEGVMLGRMFLASERQHLMEERMHARDHPETFVPCPILEGHSYQRVKVKEEKIEQTSESNDESNDEEDDSSDYVKQENLKQEIKQEFDDDDEDMTKYFVDKIKTDDDDHDDKVKMMSSCYDNRSLSSSSSERHSVADTSDEPQTSYTVKSSGERLTFVFKSQSEKIDKSRILGSGIETSFTESNDEDSDENSVFNSSQSESCFKGETGQRVLKVKLERLGDNEYQAIKRQNSTDELTSDRSEKRRYLDRKKVEKSSNASRASSSKKSSGYSLQSKHSGSCTSNLTSNSESLLSDIDSRDEGSSSRFDSRGSERHGVFELLQSQCKNKNKEQNNESIVLDDDDDDDDCSRDSYNLEAEMQCAIDSILSLQR